MDYKRILQGVVNIINITKKSDIGFANICAYIGENCPELVEGEDEKIRKALIDIVNARCELYKGITKEMFLAWLEKQGEQILANIAKTCKDEKKPNPYSGTSFDYDGHTWGMCARDNGVELFLDGELKAFLSLEKSFIYPIHPQPELAPKSALEAAKEEKVDNANKVEPKDYNDIDPHFGKPADKVEPKFHEGDIVKRKDNPHLTYILKRLTDDGDYEFHAIGKDGNEGCTCFAGVRYQDDWELVEQNPAWSEEDEKMLGAIIKDLVHPWNEYIPDRIEDEIKWLKNRLKSLRPQNHWKPSDEQIGALEHFVRSIAESGFASPYDSNTKLVYSLFNDLKKLREE